MRHCQRNYRKLRGEPLEKRLLLAGSGLPDSLVYGSAEVRFSYDDHLVGPGEVDVVEIEVDVEQDQPGRLKLWTETPVDGSLDALLRLYGVDNRDLFEDRVLFESDDVEYNDSNASIEIWLSPGKYRLEVSASPMADASSQVGQYALHADWQPGIPPFENLSVEGQPIAATNADFNGDGYLDLAVASMVTGEISIWIGLGDATFQLQPELLEVGHAPSSIVAADFNADGFVDLAVANRGSASVTVLLNQGQGDAKFTVLASVAVGDDPRAIAAADLDGDQAIDLVVANQKSGTISILFGAGDGTFYEKQEPLATGPEDDPYGGSPRGVAIKDLDGDGEDLDGDGEDLDDDRKPEIVVANRKPEIVVANRSNDEIAIFSADALGVFQCVGVVPVQSRGPYVVVIDDFDGDDDLDLATVNDKGDSVSVLLRNDDATGFDDSAYSVEVYPAGEDAESILVGLFNDDMLPDLIVGNEDTHDLSLLLNAGDDTFLSEIRIPVDHIPDDLVAGDYNKDGRLDLVVVSRENTIEVLIGLGDGTFQRDQRYRTGLDPEAIAVGDVNNDGLMDVVTANIVSDDVTVLLGRDGGRFWPGLQFDVGTAPHAIVAADFNGDGNLDVATANEFSDDVSILMGLGDGQFWLSESIWVGSSPWSLLVEDLDGDGHPDLVTANRISNDVTVLYGDGNGGFEFPQQFDLGDSAAFPEQIVAADFDLNGTIDLGTVNRLSHNVSMLLMGPNRQLLDVETADEFPQGSVDPSVVPGWDRDDTAQRQRDADAVWFMPTSLTTGDYNEDGHLDLAVANDSTNEISVFLGNPDGTYQPELRFPTAEDPEHIVAADVNKDGHLDLVTANDRINAVAIHFGRGNGVFEHASVLKDALNSALDSPEYLIVDYLDEDEVLDVVTANKKNVSVLYGEIDEDGTFTLGHEEVINAGTMPEGIVVGHFNDDNYRDLAIVNQESGDISLLIGRGDRTFDEEPRVLLQAAGPVEAIDPKSLALGDIDLDGHLDLITADVSRHSIWVLWGDGDGGFDAKTVLLDDTASGLPGDKGFAPVVVADVNGDGFPDLLEANEMDGSVSVLLGNGDRTFQPEVKYAVAPGLAHALPGTLAVGLVNADSYPDLITGNRGSHDVSILLGNGEGTFETMPPIAGGQQPAPVAMADFTGDGVDDRVVADDNTNDVFVEIGVKDGFVASSQIVAAVDRTPILTDLNGDGATDSVQVSLRGDVLVRLGQGGAPATFAPPQVVNPTERARDVAVVALATGTMLAVVNQTGKSISFYQLGPDGRFALYEELAVGSALTRIISGDVNGDGWDDLVLAESGVCAGGASVFVMLSDGQGNLLAPSPSVAVVQGPDELTLIDVAGVGSGPDDWLDVVVTGSVSGTIAVLINDGEGNYSSDRQLWLRASDGVYGVSRCPTGKAWTINSRAETSGITYGDFNSDNVMDLAVSNPGLNTFSILFGKPTGGFVDPVSLPAGSRPEQLRAAKFDGDGNLDLAVLRVGDSTIRILPGDGIGGFRSDGATVLSAGNLSAAFTIKDIDGDEHPDLVVANDPGDLLIHYGRDDGGFDAPKRAGDNVAVAVGDFDGDGQEDAVVVAESSDTLVVWLGDGDDFVERPVRGREDALAGPRAVDVVDLDGDGNQDILVTNTGANNILVYLGKGTGDFEDPRTFAAGMTPVGLSIADLNGDGLLDFVVANHLSNDVSVWLGHENRDVLLRPGPRPQLRATTGSGETVYGLGPISIETTDYNHDGHVDLIVSNLVSNNSFLFPGTGGGFFAEPSLFDVAGQVVVGQFNLSDNADLVVFTPDAQIQVYDSFRTAPSQSLTLPRQLSIPGLSGDFNRDGFQDLAILDNVEQTISVRYGSWLGLSRTWVSAPYSEPLVAAELSTMSATSAERPVEGSASGTYMVVVRADLSVDFLKVLAADDELGGVLPDPFEPYGGNPPIAEGARFLGDPMPGPIHDPGSRSGISDSDRAAILKYLADISTPIRPSPEPSPGFPPLSILWRILKAWIDAAEKYLPDLEPPQEQGEEADSPLAVGKPTRTEVTGFEKLWADAYRMVSKAASRSTTNVQQVTDELFAVATEPVTSWWSGAVDSAMQQWADREESAPSSPEPVDAARPYATVAVEAVLRALAASIRQADTETPPPEGASADAADPVETQAPALDREPIIRDDRNEQDRQSPFSAVGAVLATGMTATCFANGVGCPDENEGLLRAVWCDRKKRNNRVRQFV